jgi:hypothetical protein
VMEVIRRRLDESLGAVKQRIESSKM